MLGLQIYVNAQFGDLFSIVFLILVVCNAIKRLYPKYIMKTSSIHLLFKASEVSEDKLINKDSLNWLFI